MNFFSQVLPNFRKPGGLFQVLGIATPLIFASAGHALNLFFDRVMLARYSQEAVNAALPSGLTNFTISCFFVGVIGYANSFVAQYTGADADHRVGPSIWQAFWLSVIGGILMATGYFWAEPLFRMHNRKLIHFLLVPDQIEQVRINLILILKVLLISCEIILAIS